MANLQDRNRDNAPGAFYTDDQCICCSICSDLAPQFFRLSDDRDHNIVHSQPRTEEEMAAALEALEECPVEAIGQDGASESEPKESGI